MSFHPPHEKPLVASRRHCKCSVFKCDIVKGCKQTDTHECVIVHILFQTATLAINLILVHTAIVNPIRWYPVCRKLLFRLLSNTLPAPLYTSHGCKNVEIFFLYVYLSNVLEEVIDYCSYDGYVAVVPFSIKWTPYYIRAKT